MKTLIKENNAGGLQLEHYDDNGNIHSVVTGLEFAEYGQGLNDVVQYLQTWNYTDVGGISAGYWQDGNTDGSEYFAQDMIDTKAESDIIAEYDGMSLTLHINLMGGNGFDYFGFDSEMR